MRCTALALLALASPAAAREEAQPWPTVQATVTVAPRVTLYGEAVTRVDGDAARTDQFRTRFLAGYAVTKRLTLQAGYGHLVTYQPTTRNGMENQIAEQLLWDAGHLGPLRLLTRTRLEQRFQRGDDRTSWRLREQLRLELPLGKKVPRLVAWTEPFLIVRRSTLSPDTFDQVRSFAGLAFPVGAHATAEFGYLNQFQHRRSGDTSTDAVPLIVTMRF